MRIAAIARAPAKAATIANTTPISLPGWASAATMPPKHSATASAATMRPTDMGPT